MIHLKCLVSPKRICGVTRLMLPGWQAGPIHFLDPAVLCSVLFLVCLRDASGWLRMSLLASALHEVGHIAVCGLLVRHMPPLDVTLTGFCLHSRKMPFRAGQEALLAAAGPGANFAAACVLALLVRRRATLWRLGFLWANLLVGGFSMLPLPPLDGWHLLQLVLADKLQFRGK